MASSKNSNLYFLLKHKDFGNSSRELQVPALIIYTLTYNDGVPVQVEILISYIKFLIQKKTIQYNYMVCIPRN